MPKSKDASSASGTLVTVAVDAMGGDYAPEINIRGALLALQQDKSLAIQLFGKKEEIARLLKKRGKKSSRLSIVDCSDVITMEDHAASIRKKPSSSIAMGLQAVKDKKASAFISAGHSGAVMAGALFIVGRIADVERPAIMVKVPTISGSVILLDAGANVDCKASQLFQFAEMGKLYAEIIEGISVPKIGLLSNGAEATKGNELTRETHELLDQALFEGYIGYVEGFDLFRSTADVIVCDGFAGNVALKTAEGLADTVFQWFRLEIRRHVVSLLGLALMRKISKRFQRKFDYKPYGAAPLLGIDGVVLISHGRSNEIAIKNGILTAKKAVEQKFTDKMKRFMEEKAKPKASAQ